MTSMADTLQFGPEWLRSLSHGGSSHLSTSGGQGLAPSASRRPKPASCRYSRDEMLGLYATCENAKIPESLRALPDLLVDKVQPPVASSAQSHEEQHLMVKNSASNIRMDLDTGISRHRGRGGWNDTVSSRDDDSLPRNKQHSRDEFRDDSYGKGFDSMSHRGRGSSTLGGKETAGPPRHPEFSRSMSSDNWRDAKKRETETDVSTSWRSRADAGRSGSTTYSVRSWREPAERDTDGGRGGRARRGSDSLHHDRGDYTRRKGGGYDGRNYGDSEDEEADLPEWSTEGVEDIGTFDASGAFIPMGDDHDFEALEDDDGGLKEEEYYETNDMMSSNYDDEGAGISHDNGSNDDGGEFGGAEKGASIAVGNAIEPDTSPAAPTTVSTDIHPSNEAASSSPPSEAPAAVSTATVVPPNIADNLSMLSDGDIDFGRLDLDAENLVASLLPDDESFISGAGQDPRSPAPAENQKGFVAADHQDAHSWFYKDPQGVIQGPFGRMEMSEWFSAGFFSHSLLVKRGLDSSFIQLGELMKKVGSAPFAAERKSPSQFVPIAAPAPTPVAADIRVTAAAVAVPTDANQTSTDQLQLLQTLLKKQQQQQQSAAAPLAPAASLPQQQPSVSQQQQALIQLLLQSQSRQASQQQPPTSAFQMPSMQQQMAASAVQSQQPGGPTQPAAVRPRAIKSQQSQQMADTTAVSTATLQHQALERELAKMEAAAKIAELSGQSSGGPLSLLQMLKPQQQQQMALGATNIGRPLTHGLSSNFHRSVSQPIDMDLSGLASTAGSGWTVPTKAAGVDGAGLHGGPPQLWRANSVVPSVPESVGGWKPEYSGRLTVEELEKMQFMAAEKARQMEQQQRQSSMDLSAAINDLKSDRQLEQLKMALLQQMHQRQQTDDRRVIADKLNDFDRRERQRQEEIRRRLERAEELRRHHPFSGMTAEQISVQLALAGMTNGFGAGSSASVDQARREFAQSLDQSQLAAAGSNYWMTKDVPTSKPAAGLSQWQSAGGNFPLVHSKMPSESSTWEELAASLNAKGIATGGAGSGGGMSAGNQMLPPRSVTGVQQPQPAKKDESVQMLVVQVATYKEEFARWCDAAVKSLHTNINVPTFLRHLAEIESPNDVAQCVRTYLGSSKETLAFVQMYLEKREMWRHQNKMLQEMVLQCMKSGNKWN